MSQFLRGLYINFFWRFYWRVWWVVQVLWSWLLTQGPINHSQTMLWEYFWKFFWWRRWGGREGEVEGRRENGEGSVGRVGGQRGGGGGRGKEGGVMSALLKSRFHNRGAQPLSCRSHWAKSTDVFLFQIRRCLTDMSRFWLKKPSSSDGTTDS